MKKLIIDTDAGIDDIAAILVAFKANVEIIAFTIVEGNVDIPEGVLNAQRLNMMDGRQIPIYKGSTPLIQGIFTPERWPGHGIDGLGGFTGRDEYKGSMFHGSEHIPVSDEHASIALVRMVNEFPNQIDIVALGPLTNIALAIKLDPLFLHKVNSVVIMGGCVYAKGNSNNTAEFNIHYDPESAHIVFQAAIKASTTIPKLTLVPWETTLDNAFEWSFLESFASTFESDFLKAILEFARSSSSKPGYPKSEFEEHQVKMSKCVLPDVSAMIAYLYPESILEYHDWDIKVELYGFHTRGTTHMQWIQIGDVNTRVVLKMNAKMVAEIVKESVS